MLFQELLGRSDALVGLVSDFTRIRAKLVRKTSQKAIKAYAASHAIRKLHLGAGPGGLPGWLNTDIQVHTDKVVYLDATRPFLIEDATFDYVFSEHMIEHMSWRAGLCMLRECRRVLKPTGLLRIATPDLGILLGLYGHNGGELGERYVRWIIDRYMNGVNAYKASFVINNAFRRWDHKFLYDGELLELALREAGFTGIRRCAPGESTDENLRGIESHGMNVGDREMAAFETMVFEARPDQRHGDHTVA